MSSFIQQSIDDGSLVLYHDYRLREARDLSGNGNHGALTDVQWTGRGARFPQSTSKITVADSPELQLSGAGTLAMYGQTFVHVANDIFFGKRDGGGTNYQFYTGSGNLALFDGSVVRTLVTDISGSNYVAVNLDNTPKAFIDGVYRGLFNGDLNFTPDDAPLGIASLPTTSNQNFRKRVWSALIFNRPLTETEHARLYCELAAKKFPTKLVGHTAAPLWKTDYGAYETESAVTSGPIGGTPFKVQSGSFKISRDAIDGEAVKVIECVTAGICYVPTSYFQQTPSQAAYGVWKWWVLKASDLNNIHIGFISDQKDYTSSDNGYRIRYTETEQLRLQKRTAGSTTNPFITVSGFLSNQLWYKTQIERTPVGEFSVYLNDLLVDTSGGSGSNPIIDNAFVESGYFVLDLDAGDKIAYADIKGNHSIVKEV